MWSMPLSSPDAVLACLGHPMALWRLVGLPEEGKVAEHSCLMSRGEVYLYVL